MTIFSKHLVGAMALLAPHGYAYEVTATIASFSFANVSFVQ